MKTYTVVGLYRDNKQVWVGTVDAIDAIGAVSKAKREVKEAQKQYDLEINVLSVFEGDHKDLYGEDEIMED
jgi:hypothetical protein